MMKKKDKMRVKMIKWQNKLENRKMLMNMATTIIMMRIMRRNWMMGMRRWPQCSFMEMEHTSMMVFIWVGKWNSRIKIWSRRRHFGHGNCQKGSNLLLDIDGKTKSRKTSNPCEGDLGKTMQ
jgi:hypothetical protein